ncbi:ABC transporter ATP-binding protein [Denitrobaculum tricleocarpae]|uniref:ATP-binding cassette domain-containing protein n=1 Tax=Denitrobaculum tricleocarpae TaxID=2591009 RepID=A0A545U178_9PROT|nr:ABC transporter ATP-binding protein [Denitrobaculum tricleocarpae]TQV83194.1 ATP-binding cassette domain-containing protein [Denitrobaculum tricleocarpae]
MLSVRRLRRPDLLEASLTLADGECLAIRGASGSGKSLLLRAIADLDPNEGEVTLDGVHREDIPAPDWRRQVCYLPAEAGWWADDLGAHFNDWDRASAFFQRLGLEDARKDWPIARLSTGERQRFALSRALAINPRVLLLDEPTSGLDQAAITAVEGLIAERLQTGTGVIWVTHDPVQAERVADRWLYLENGRLRQALPLPGEAVPREPEAPLSSHSAEISGKAVQ